MAASQVQTLLRFLSQDAKIPLAAAMTRAMELQKANLKTWDEPSLLLMSRTSTKTY